VSSGTKLQPYSQDVLEFFEKTIPDQIHLTAIDPIGSRAAEGHDFGMDAPAACAWALAHNAGGFNIYFTVNRIKPNNGANRKKSDIVAVRFAHVDVDPPKDTAGWTEEEREKALQRLKRSDPSIIFCSGNGWQALWRQDDGISIDQIEEINRGLIAAHDGDAGTHDASRLLRVPGLINYPNLAKQTRGRIPALAKIVTRDDGSCTTREMMMARFPAPPKAQKSERAEISLHYDLGDVNAESLGLASDDALRLLIDAPSGVDRSKSSFGMACEALRRGLLPHQVYSILLNPKNAISGHCLDQSDPIRAAERVVTSALGEDDVRIVVRARDRERERQRAADETDEIRNTPRLWTIEEMIRECVLIEDGSQISFVNNPRRRLAFSDFKLSTAASKMKVTAAGKGTSIRMVDKLVAEVWSNHIDRLSTETVTFRPSGGAFTTSPSGAAALNTWAGYKFDTPPDDWLTQAEPFIAHVRWLFGEDTDAFLDWLAHLAQKPGELPNFAFLHISKQHGMGRNWIASILGRAFVGYAALAYDLSGTLRTGYNGLLAGKVLAVVDEINEGNSNRRYQVQQELKQLITEETRAINPKYGRQHTEFNCCRWLIFSNSATALPLEEEDRRTYVVQCDEKPKGEEYYRTLYRLRDNRFFIGSVAKFLSVRDITGFNPGAKPPMTDAREALLARCRNESEQTLIDLAARWPVDIVTSREIQDILGEDSPSGAALRYALERAGIVKVAEWRSQDKGNTFSPIKGRIRAYAVRNISVWKDKSKTILTREIARVGNAEKEKAFYLE
jgi:hypothetical protein